MVRILIADDEMIEREVLCKTLRKNLRDRCIIFQAENGREALKVYEEHKIQQRKSAEKIKIAVLFFSRHLMSLPTLKKLLRSGRWIIS